MLFAYTPHFKDIDTAPLAVQSTPITELVQVGRSNRHGDLRTREIEGMRMETFGRRDLYGLVLFIGEELIEGIINNIEG